MKKEVREFLEEEAVGAARSKQAKRDKRKKRQTRFLMFLAKKAANLEANGSSAAAAQFRKFWGQFPGYEKSL